MQYDGEDLTIAFNARFLIEMLNATDSDEVKIELSYCNQSRHHETHRTGRRRRVA
jgi:DNA polymerase III sliding clamp (beta) subunit (PCNA family)